MKQIEQKLDSREVAEMMEVRHTDLLRKIDGINKDFKKNNEDCAQRKIAFSKYWEESTYKDGSGRANKNYLITKMGCEFLANKSTGTKGNLFTARYIERFHEMENYIEEVQAPKKLSAIEQLKLQNEAILEVNTKIDRLENDMPLFKAECDELQSLVKKVGIKHMGGKDASAYKDNSLRGKIYSDIQHQLRREFGVDKYAWIKHSQFDIAKKIILDYVLPIALEEEVKEMNSQLSFEEM